tara:strand:- start:698 stop:1276 length:579 start_codon:yes stop_codon:yes gene_type:complete
MSFMLLGILNSQAAADAGGPAYEVLSTVTLTGTTTAIIFDDLDLITDYKHFQLRCSVRNSLGASGATAMRLKFNEITSGYNSHRLYAQGGSGVYQSDNFSAGDIHFGMVPYANTSLNAWGVSIVDIPDYQSTDKFQSIKAFSGLSADLGNENRVEIANGSLQSSVAINQIRIQTDNGSMVSGSTISLIGIRG